MARTSRKTTAEQQPGNVVVELEPGIADQDPVAQHSDLDADDQAEQAGDGDEPRARSRDFSLNEVRMIGRIAKATTLNWTASGMAVGYLRVATNGVREGDTQFHQLTVFGKTAEFAAKYLGTGRRVYVEGRLENRSWTDSEGIRRLTTTIVVNRLQALDYRRPEADQQAAAQ